MKWREEKSGKQKLYIFKYMVKPGYNVHTQGNDQRATYKGPYRSLIAIDTRN